MRVVWLTAGSVLGFLGVALGAFGAHALRERLTPEMLAIYQTGVQYHLVHALALCAVGLLSRRRRTAALDTAGGTFLAGVFLFSGSLYLLAMTEVRWLGAITPLGGVAFLVGWLALASVGLARR